MNAVYLSCIVSQMEANALADKVVALVTQGNLLAAMLEFPKEVLSSAVNFSTPPNVREPVVRLQGKNWQRFFTSFESKEKKHCQSESTRATSLWKQTQSSEINDLSTAMWRTGGMPRKHGHPSLDVHIFFEKQVFYLSFTQFLFSLVQNVLTFSIIKAGS